MIQIGDALVKLNIRHGGYLHGLKMFSPYQQASTRKISGPVFPVKMVDADDKSAPKPSQHSADAVKKDSVVFVLQPANYFAACWGGLMSTRAKYLDAQGVVIDGSFRDVNEHRDLEFSVRVPSDLDFEVQYTNKHSAFCLWNLCSRLNHLYDICRARGPSPIHITRAIQAYPVDH
jgi:regulator of RNase E activity RraA